MWMTATNKRSLAVVLSVFVTLLFLGCEEEETNVKDTVARGSSKLITVETRIGGYNDTLQTVYADLKQADVNNLDIVFIATGIKDRDHVRAQLQVTPHADALVKTYIIIVEFYVTYYDSYAEQTRSESKDMTIELDVR